jgi:serine/threonine protein kinase
MRTPQHRRFARQGILQPGTTLGSDLTIRSVLGEGGTGVVYCAYHAVLKRDVAVKMCHGVGPGSRELVERLVQEARMCASVRDARVPRIYSLDKLEDGTFYLVMEKVHGEALSSLLARGHIAVRAACVLTCELLRALEAVHRAQVIHRDVKPSNLIVDLQGEDGPQLRLLDFGIGKVITSGARVSPALTRPGEVVGTPMYMAPEQMTESAIDPRVDIYAAGVVLYEMLAGRPPFRAPSVAETFVAVLHDEMPRLATLRPDLPEALAAVVHKAASRKAADRFTTAHEMRLALEAAMQELPAEDVQHELFIPRPEEQSPTLVWKRVTQADESSEYRRYGRPLPASLARTLKPARRRERESILPTATPVGFRARRRPIATKAVGGWRVQSLSF